MVVQIDTPFLEDNSGREMNGKQNHEEAPQALFSIVVWFVMANLYPSESMLPGKHTL